MWQNVAISLMLAQAPETLTPADAMVAAHADLEKLAPSVRPYVRYLSLHNLTDRADAIAVLCGHVNQLSREADITRPALVSGFLLRINLEDYGWNAEVWERLEDPYFTVTVERLYDTKDAYGRWGVHKKFREQALAPWLSETAAQKAVLAQVVEWTQSKVPVVRADWWFNQTAASVDRKAGYYEWLGIKDRKTFQELGGFDRKIIEKFRKELRESVAVSGVTLQPRALVRFDSPGGAYWFSVDFKKALDKANPLRVLGADIEAEADAYEEYISLPNGFWATGLFDRAGKRQDAAPDFIASDGLAKGNDRRVHVNVSCVRCHKDGGLQDIDGWTRNLLNPPLELRSPDYKKARELRQQYLRKLEPFLARDRAVYGAAVLEATGKTAKEYAAIYGAFWEVYEDAKVDTAYAARDLGLTEKVFREKLLAYLKASGNLDPVASVFLHEGARARSMPMRQYEEIYPILQSVIRGYTP